MTIHSRITEMKVIAAHLDRAGRANGLLSLRDFVREAKQGILVISKDSDYGLTQDPMNGVVFLRLMQLLDKEQQHPERKVFVVIDEFPTLAGDKPCLAFAPLGKNRASQPRVDRRDLIEQDNQDEDAGTESEDPDGVPAEAETKRARVVGEGYLYGVQEHDDHQPQIEHRSLPDPKQDERDNGQQHDGSADQIFRRLVQQVFLGQ